MSDLHRDAVLGQLANETAERLGFRMPPEVVLRINREAHARVEANGLNVGEDYTSVAQALESASKHVLETEERWAKNGAPTQGWWWDQLSKAYEMYWDIVNGSTGFFLELLDKNGVELPLLQS